VSGGTVVGCGGRGGGPNDVHVLTVELEHKPPRVISKPVGSARPDPTFAFTLSGDESRVFDLSAIAASCWCRWNAYLELTVGGEHKEARIDDHGRPFETVGTFRTPDARYIDHRWTRLAP
jgi:hypothetical protein